MQLKKHTHSSKIIRVVVITTLWMFAQGSPVQAFPVFGGQNYLSPRNVIQEKQFLKFFYSIAAPEIEIIFNPQILEKRKRIINGDTPSIALNVKDMAYLKEMLPEEINLIIGRLYDNARVYAPLGRVEVKAYQYPSVHGYTDLKFSMIQESITDTDLGKLLHNFFGVKKYGLKFLTDLREEGKDYTNRGMGLYYFGKSEHPMTLKYIRRSSKELLTELYLFFPEVDTAEIAQESIVAQINYSI